ncbi:Predicted kinase, aminoglycoside phosphotransferase (APT) family [Solimonas aquatica]|uniref:Predicted kinase, aminoglycoside phosphotransferase (APT) family n=1 Tax=Solimonas aquatica TaxID=489703 RepID=A0A1H9L923_9GAMM|nr:phosphotransferase family protein [Solimonas aquatica]SER07719.1 Predicted kinase, aminoglycoside phosphotransferase (APT) family [Solimonas aquatica]
MSAQLPFDSAGTVRAGEELDAAAVTAWLRAQGIALQGQPRVTQYAGGASNWTYRLQYENRDLILRRPPAGTKARSAHDMKREFTVQQALRPVFPCVANMVALCSEPAVIGSEFYVMDRIAGMIPRKNLPPGVVLSPEQTRQLCLSMVDKLIELHQVDVQAAGLQHLGKGAGYVRRQVEGWCERWQRAATWNVLSGRRVMHWLRQNMPEDVASCVIHNDWRLDNLVFDAQQASRVIGVLDWEMATLGDPLMELGCVIAYWLQADDDRFILSMRRQPSHLPGMLRRREIVAYYLERTGLQPENWVFYEVFGLFRLAAIIQQIYYRYHHRQTRNPAFARFWLLSNYLVLRAARTIRRGPL